MQLKELSLRRTQNTEHSNQNIPTDRIRGYNNAENFLFSPLMNPGASDQYSGTELLIYT